MTAAGNGCTVATANEDRAISTYRLTREQRHTITTLAYPIIGAMASQNIVNLVDTAMVGTLGDKALAAVGMSGFVNFMAVSFMMGMSSGVQATCARWKGAGRSGEMALPLNGGLLLAVLICFPLTVALYLATPAILSALSPEPAVAATGTDYLRLRLFGMTAVGMNFTFRGYWNAMNMSRLYMATLISMHLCGIALNWVLIFGHLGAPAMGAKGAGLSNAISAAKNELKGPAVVEAPTTTVALPEGCVGRVDRLGNLVIRYTQA